MWQSITEQYDRICHSEISGTDLWGGVLSLGEELPVLLGSICVNGRKG